MTSAEESDARFRHVRHPVRLLVFAALVGRVPLALGWEPSATAGAGRRSSDAVEGEAEPPKTSIRARA